MLSCQNFFTDDYVDQASYDNLRKIASAVDGLKNSSRKVIHTCLDKNISDLVKVQQLSAKAAEYTDYLHGSMDGVIVTLGADYLGTNQIPLLTKKGNFGTRMIPQPSASRYIFAKSSKILPQLFLKKDREILDHQIFEGQQIEPRVFMPVLPLLLINGNRGISSGFSQLILGRDAKKIKAILEKRLKGQINNFNEINELEPTFDTPTSQFKGKIVKDGEGYRWSIQGSLEKVKETKKTTTYRIQEVPLGTSLTPYLALLNELQEAKKIKTWDDLSTGDNFQFEVQVESDVKESQLFKWLKLETFITENFTSMRVDNVVEVFETPADIAEHYYHYKLKYLQLRKNQLVQNLKEDIEVLNSKWRFINAYLSNDIDFEVMPVKSVLLYLEENDYPKVSGTYNYLMTLPLTTLIKENMDKLQRDIEEAEEDLKQLQSTTLENMWLEDLKDLKL